MIPQYMIAGKVKYSSAHHRTLRHCYFCGKNIRGKAWTNRANKPTDPALIVCRNCQHLIKEAST